MSQDTRLLTHLASRLKTPREDLATEALGFLLQQSPLARETFNRLIRTMIRDIGEPVTYRTQKANNSGSRPDLIGVDANGIPLVVVEAKFWAGLTNNQPVEYLQRIMEVGHEPAVLVVIAPRRRLQSLWPELLRLCKASNLFPDLTDVSTANGNRVAQVSERVWVAQTTWDHVLDTLLAEASTQGERSLTADVLQLQSLAAQQDLDAFIPLQSTDISQETPRLIIDLNELVQDLVHKASRANLLELGTFQWSANAAGRGRYFTVDGIGGWVGLSFEYWSKFRPTPLWLLIQKWSNQPEEPYLAARDRLQSLELESPPRLIQHPEQPWLLVPLTIPFGAERDDVLDNLLEQVREISDRVRNR